MCSYVFEIECFIRLNKYIFLLFFNIMRLDDRTEEDTNL